MRLVTYVSPGSGAAPEYRVGALLTDGVRILDFRDALAGQGNLEGLPREPLAWFDLDRPWLRRASALYAEIVGEADSCARADQAGWLVTADSVRLGPAVPTPRKVICIGLNYRDHAAESGSPVPERPVVFSKFPTAIVGPDDPVILPPTSEKVDYEAELAVVIGRRAKRVPRERAYEHVLGYANFNDVSARDFQFGDGQWQRGKSCDTFGPIGPWIVMRDRVADPHRLAIALRLNGATMQSSSTSNMIFGVPELVAFISETITLEPGDVIATGTPPGVGFARKPPVFLKPGDVMEVEVEGLGVLRNPVAAADHD
jgi:2-keto-4-pentenoate hydratase/2-oxohepta-3-ene-1,7-dioic acid hydratase in catechol pathway